jgi:ComF family protein
MHWNLLKKWKNNFIDFFFPNVCVVCGIEGKDLCFKCYSFCTPAKPFFIKSVPIFPCFYYSSSIAKIIKDIKYYQKSENAKIMAKFIVTFFKEELKEGEIFIPIPINFFKRLKRRYNIPHLICLYLENKFNKKNLNVIHKKDWKSQVGLGRFERKKNVTNSFRIKNGIEITGKTIILIDDVITTGATIEAAILEISKWKPKQIKVFTFAYKELETHAVL